MICCVFIPAWQIRSFGGIGATLRHANAWPNFYLGCGHLASEDAWCQRYFTFSPTAGWYCLTSGSNLVGNLLPPMYPFLWPSSKCALRMCCQGRDGVRLQILLQHHKDLMCWHNKDMTLKHPSPPSRPMRAMRKQQSTCHVVIHGRQRQRCWNQRCRKRRRQQRWRRRRR